MSFVVDIDDTLISTRERTRGLWRSVLGCDVSIDEIESMNARQIFERYATPEQRPRMRELQAQFTETMLCRNRVGVDLMKLDKPIPYAAEVLREWHSENKIIYFTGRLERVRSETVSQLKTFGFPLEDTELIMFKEEDWGQGRVIEARRKTFEGITSGGSVVRVVDDFPGYFPIYEEYGVPERIGLIRSMMHTERDFLERGATKVVRCWSELKGL
jgi:hypothetical protein